MAFIYSERNREEYLQEGLTILRGLIPATLLADLRREADKARELARSEHGPQAQRLQPVFKYSELNHQPFRDFYDLQGLRDTVSNILGPEYTGGEITGILFEPQEQAWCTHWHRDWGYNVPDLDLDAFFEAAANPDIFNQFNGALYDDHSLWVVPGSHNRRDTAEEQAAFSDMPPPPPDLASATTNAEREERCHDYIYRMPNAMNVQLLAGDIAFYRACCWHIGVYVPYTRRATLHDGFYGSADREWRAGVAAMQERVRRERSKI